jgi:hypothetical protein
MRATTHDRWFELLLSGEKVFSTLLIILAAAQGKAHFLA